MSMNSMKRQAAVQAGVEVQARVVVVAVQARRTAQAQVCIARGAALRAALRPLIPR